MNMTQSKVYDLIKIPYDKTTTEKVPDAMEHFIIPYKNNKYFLYYTRKGVVSIVNKEFINKINTDDPTIKELLKRIMKQPTVNITKEEDFTTRPVLELTTDCNLRCVYCYANGGDNPKYMDWKTAKAAIDYFIKRQLHKTFILTFHGGGEQTLAFPMMKRCYEYAKKLCDDSSMEITPKITTNGIITEDIIKWFKKVNMDVMLSFDGLPDIQNRQRPLVGGGESYPILKRTIKLLNKYKVKFCVNVVLSTNAKYTAIINHLHKLGVKKCIFAPALEWGRCPGSYDPLYNPYNDKNRKKLLKCVKFANKNNMFFRSNDTTPVFSEELCDRACGASGSYIIVTHDGYITSCLTVLKLSDPSSKTFFYGKIVDGEVKINKSKLNYLRSRTTENMETCKNCWAKYSCVGGCSHFMMQKTNSIFKPPEKLCAFRREQYRQKLIEWIEDFKDNY